MSLAPITRNPTSEDYLKLHWIIFLNSFTPSVVVLIEIPPFEILLYRTLAAAILLYGFILVKKYPLFMGWKETLKLLAAGFLVFLYWGLSFLAIKISTASVGLVGMATTSLWITFLQPMISNQRTRPFQVLVGINAITGIYIIYNSDFEYSSGLAIGIIGAFFGAMLTIFSSNLSKKHNHFVVTFYQMVGACSGALFFIPLYQSLFKEAFSKPPVLADMVLLLGLAFVFSIYAYSVFISVMKTVPPFTVSLVSNLSPIYGIFIAILFFGESEYMNIGFYLGTSLLLISVFAYPLLSNYMRVYAENKRKEAQIASKEW